MGKETRAKLLEVAEKLFFEKEYEEVSIRDLTEAAGTNVASINYHFNGKENLYKEVFSRFMRRVGQERVAEMKAAAEGASDPKEAAKQVIRAYVHSFLSALLSVPNGEVFLSILAREMSARGMANEEFLKEAGLPIHNALKDAIRTACPEFSDVKLSLCASSISGQLFHFVRARHSIKQFTGRDYDMDFINDLTDHVTEFSIRGLFCKGLDG